MVEKQRGKDLGKVVTGGGRAQEKQTTEDTEDTEKTKPQRAQRGRAATKQVWRHKKSSRAEKNLRASSTEGTENTEIGREGADTLVRPYTAWRVEVERAVVRAGWRWDSRTAQDCVALPA